MTQHSHIKPTTPNVGYGQGKRGHHPDPTETHRSDSVPDLEVDPAHPEHRLRPRSPTPWPRFECLRLPSSTGAFLSTLFAREWFHRKGLPVGFGDQRRNRSKYFQDDPFRYFLIDPTNPSRLLQG